jgi:hypothetical protein
MRRTIAALAAAAMLSVPMFGAPLEASAANNTAGDSLVNVQVGDVTIARDVNVAVVATVIATVCDVNVDVVALATQVDATGKKATVCRTATGPVTIRQN